MCECFVIKYAIVGIYITKPDTSEYSQCEFCNNICYNNKTRLSRG